MGSDLPGGPSAATSQIVSFDVATGARTVLTSGPGRKYQPKWVGDGVAYTRGEVDERRGVRQRVNYVAHGISFTDGRADVAGVFSNVNWSSDGMQSCSIGRSKARGHPSRRRSAATVSLPSSVRVSTRRTRPTAAS